MKKRTLTKADIDRLGPAAKAQVLAQLVEEAAPGPRRTPPSPPHRHHDVPWGILYAMLFVVLLVIVWRLLIGV